MSNKLPTIGKISNKEYQCTKCGHKHFTETNHWGHIYPRCKGNCNSITIHKCLEPVPKEYGIPAMWKIAKLGDICKIE